MAGLCYTLIGGFMETAANLNNSGIALTEANRPFEAIPLFREALCIEPGNPLLWLNLGIAQQKTGEYGEALESYQRAVNIDDDLVFGGGVHLGTWHRGCSHRRKWYCVCVSIFFSNHLHFKTGDETYGLFAHNHFFVWQYCVGVFPTVVSR